MATSTQHPDPTGQTAAMAEQLRRTGFLTREYRAESEGEQLRRRARRAARSIGRPVRTQAHAGTMTAALADWPANPLEERLSESRANNSIDRALRE
ncbi:hypothetical protein [Actinomadura oligospora]|uniref:hypothetical protein n=1 Tax=Actinomadura oligospora TaxID=111804 RepID=UPI00047D263F|nr:hypothetical protein [Actinomadura oligospora]